MLSAPKSIRLIRKAIKKNNQAIVKNNQKKNQLNKHLTSIIKTVGIENKRNKLEITRLKKVNKLKEIAESKRLAKKIKERKQKNTGTDGNKKKTK